MMARARAYFFLFFRVGGLFNGISCVQGGRSKGSPCNLLCVIGQDIGGGKDAKVNIGQKGELCSSSLNKNFWYNIRV